MGARVSAHVVIVHKKDSSASLDEGLALGKAQLQDRRYKVGGEN